MKSINESINYPYVLYVYARCGRWGHLWQETGTVRHNVYSYHCNLLCRSTWELHSLTHNTWLTMQSELLGQAVMISWCHQWSCDNATERLQVGSRNISIKAQSPSSVVAGDDKSLALWGQRPTRHASIFTIQRVIQQWSKNVALKSLINSSCIGHTQKWHFICILHWNHPPYCMCTKQTYTYIHKHITSAVNRPTPSS